MTDSLPFDPEKLRKSEEMLSSPVIADSLADPCNRETTAGRARVFLRTGKSFCSQFFGHAPSQKGDSKQELLLPYNSFHGSKGKLLEEGKTVV